uniref:Odorant-binding protein 7 n=1 Tax=Tropidothorax elegans TaxID=2233830 RepID=A0A2Z5EM77_9HEMI|nr:odorant-binding protein 7 [Tropidothorax elegans]
MSPSKLVVCIIAVIYHTATTSVVTSKNCDPKQLTTTELCCKIPSLDHTKPQTKALEKYGGFMRTCHNELRRKFQPLNVENPSLEKQRINECLMECLAEKAEVLKNGVIDYKSLKELVFEFLDDKERWMPALDNVFEKCEEVRKQNLTGDEICKSGTLSLSICLLENAYLNCPGEYWIDNNVCNEEKEFIERCSFAERFGI